LSRPPIPKLAAFLTSILVAASALAAPGSWEFVESTPGNYDYGEQLTLPPQFGSAEFTFEMWVRLDDSFPVGSTAGGANQRQNWSDSDNQPYSSNDWWWAGNFLIDGHNNSDFNSGTFSLQVYGGGRIRWLFGDGIAWAVQAFPATTTPSLLDGQWHQITLVRRWSGSSTADLEMWIDGSLVATETSSLRTNMATTYWNSWSGYPNNQAGWFYAAEKQVAIDTVNQWEDYKGLVDEIRFWSRAKSAAEIAANYASPVTGSESGLVGNYQFGEAQGTQTCDSINPGTCITFINPTAATWSASNAPLSSGGDTQAPTTPTNVQGAASSTSQIDLTWTASTDNIGVTAYDIRRDGTIVGSTSTSAFSDTGLAASTSYDYTVTARDAAGNASPESTTVTVVTPASQDVQAPTTPTNVQGAASSTSQIDLTWTASTDNVAVTAYDVRRDGTVVGSTPSSSYSDTGLTANTSYEYTVTARDAAGNVSPQSTAIVVVTPASQDVQAPTTPTNLQGLAVTPSRVDLNWTDSTDNIGVTGYDVRRDGMVVGSIPTSNYSDTGLTANTSYEYTVAARDATGNVSSQSTIVTVVTPVSQDVQAPTVPNGLQSTTISDSRIDLSWNASADNVGVIGYDIRRNGNVVGSTANTAFSDTGLNANTSYVHTVLAKDAAGNQSLESNSSSATTSTRPPVTPPPQSSGGSGSFGITMILGLFAGLVRSCSRRLRTRGSLQFSRRP